MIVEPPRVDVYRLVCAMCGQERTLHLTRSDTVVLPAQRCSQCGGRMFLEPTLSEVA